MIIKKAAKDEQFPVSMLINPKLRPIVSAYYQAARYADDIADDPFFSSKEKLVKLSSITNAFLSPDDGDNYKLVRNLGHIFVSENLDASLYLDLLKAFEQDASFTPIRIWEELINYCRNSAAPVGRFLLAIYNERPTAYIPAENLCIILQILNHLGDIKNDLSYLQRCYIPLDIMQKYGVKLSDLGLNYTTDAVKKLIDDILIRLEQMVIDVQILPHIIQNFSLRFDVCVILSLTNYMLKKYKQADILQKSPKLTICDWAKSIVKGFIKSIFCKKYA